MWCGTCQQASIMTHKLFTLSDNISLVSTGYADRPQMSLDFVEMAAFFPKPECRYNGVDRNFHLS